ncbi:MAG: LytR/AlgR family response regulator transcription factor [Chitinophagaceae bacterium]
MVRAIIIEDEQHAAKLLEEMLHEINPSIKILEKCSDLPAGVKSIKKNAPDIVFLDIELPVYSGIQLLDFFNPEEITFHIIFTTASNEYAVRAFEMSAVDYLMKPIQEEKLQAAIEKILRKQASSGIEMLPVLKHNFQQEASRKIVVPVTYGYEILNLKDICYFKAEGSYTQIFFTTNKSMLVSKNLKHFEFILTGLNNFIRIHRSFVVNINFAKKILRKDGGILFLENNTELPVADDKMPIILESLQKL